VPPLLVVEAHQAAAARPLEALARIHPAMVPTVS
jgi:hypothetical protein